MRLYTDFDSIDQVLAVVDSPLPKGSDDASRKEPREDWDLNLGWDGAYAAYTGGWAEGAKRALDLADRLAPKPRANRTTLSRSVSGAFPNVGAHLAGAPNAMYRVSKKASVGRPYVHLWVPISFAARVNADTAFDRGCALVAVIDALENAGCRVKVSLTRTSKLENGVHYCMRFMVKDYADRLDIDQVMFTVAHPAFFRRIGFALQERSEHEAARKQTQMGYGSPVDADSEDCPEDGGNTVRVMFPRLENHFGMSPEQFLRQMVEALPQELQTEIN